LVPAIEAAPVRGLCWWVGLLFEIWIVDASIFVVFVVFV